MFNFFKKKREIFPEAIIASDWWASKLLEPTVKHYNGSMCYSIQKENIPSDEKVAVFRSNLAEVINSRLEECLYAFPYILSISSSDAALIKMALDADIDDFESHFGDGAKMFIDSDGVSVKEKRKNIFKIRK